MITEGLKGRDFITLRDFSQARRSRPCSRSACSSRPTWPCAGPHQDILPGRTLLMMFFNPSLRTRNSFEAGIFQLGGHAHFLEPSSMRLPTLEGEDVPYQSERIADVARVLSQHGRRDRRSASSAGLSTGSTTSRCRSSRSSPSTPRSPSSTWRTTSTIPTRAWPTR